MTYQPPTALPRDLLDDVAVQRALADHDFGAVFRLARDRAGISYSRIAAECDIKPERVGTLARGQGRITTFDKIVMIADALRIPGRMVGLAPRPGRRTDLLRTPTTQRSEPAACAAAPSSRPLPVLA